MVVQADQAWTASTAEAGGGAVMACVQPRDVRGAAAVILGLLIVVASSLPVCKFVGTRPAQQTALSVHLCFCILSTLASPVYIRGLGGDFAI